MGYFGTFHEFLFTFENVARFARNVEWDFFWDFQTLWGITQTDWSVSAVCLCYPIKIIFQAFRAYRIYRITLDFPVTQHTYDIQ